MADHDTASDPDGHSATLDEGQSRRVAELTEQELLQLQQFSQLSYWGQRRRQPKESVETQSVHSAGIPERWRLLGDVSLYPWQQEAIGQWARAGNRGIIKVVTGAGKTILALGAIEMLQHSECPDLHVVVVVPTVVLMDQWREILLSRSNLPPNAIATIGGATKARFDAQTRIVIAVLNSAATKLSALVHHAGIGDRLLLIVDECHRAGALERRKLFETPRAFSMGLSATPERGDDDTVEDFEFDGDDRRDRPATGDEVLSAELGPIVYEMTYAEAVQSGVLAHFVVEHYGLALTPEERGHYERLSREITDLRRELEGRLRRGLALVRWCRSKSGQNDPRARRFLALANERRHLLFRAEARLQAIHEIIRRAFQVYEQPRIIIFHESIEDVMIIFDSLRRLGFPVVAEHSEFPDRLRGEAIRLFRSGTAQIIVSARSLIEGFNVPAADIGIIAAASASVRQRVQTLGRLLRPDPGREKSARLVVLYAERTVDEMIYEKADWEQFIGAERNEYYRWLIPEKADPDLIGVPPRRPRPTDQSIDPNDLYVGDEYPGVFEGTSYSVDTQGNVTDEDGNLHRPSRELSNIFKKRMRGGGRFTVSPLRRFLLKMERREGTARVLFLGIAPDPLFVDNATQTSQPGTDDAVAAFGHVYPFAVEGAKRFSVLQRDARLIAKKEGGSVRFILPPERLQDTEKAAQLREIIDRLHMTYRSGRHISRILVTATGDVVYASSGNYYFVGRAPEGADGFSFE